MQIYQVVYIKSDKPNVPPAFRSIYPRLKVVEPTLTAYSNRNTSHYFGYIICMYVMYRNSQNIFFVGDSYLSTIVHSAVLHALSTKRLYISKAIGYFYILCTILKCIHNTYHVLHIIPKVCQRIIIGLTHYNYGFYNEYLSYTATNCVANVKVQAAC